MSADDDLTIALIVAGLVYVASRVVPELATTDDRPATFYALADAIAAAEGFGVAGAIPTVRNNPGDLKLDGQTITTFATADDGWNALYHQLDLISSGDSNYYSPSFSLSDFARVWTSTEQSAWLNNVINGLHARGVSASASTTLGDLL